MTVPPNTTQTGDLWSPIPQSSSTSPPLSQPHRAHMTLSLDGEQPANHQRTGGERSYRPIQQVPAHHGHMHKQTAGDGGGGHLLIISLSWFSSTPNDHRLLQISRHEHASSLRSAGSTILGGPWLAGSTYGTFFFFFFVRLFPSGVATANQSNPSPRFNVRV